MSLTMSQTSRKRKAQTPEDSNGSIKQNESQENEGRAGRILKIYLRNFMCHDSLSIDFNTNISYIIGRNGSGKSAVLAALVVGLGGRANITNRGNTVKGFIQVGKNSATVEITLSNCGLMAYQPETYGSKIIICRIISDSGTSTYKLKNENGNVVSQSCKEIHMVLRCLNIQIDNPICLLNQDVARTFLNTTDNTVTYNLFMKATNLENVHLELEGSIKNEKNTGIILQQKNDELKELWTEVEKWKKKYEAIQSIVELEDKKMKLDTECVWAMFYALQGVTVELSNELKEMQEQLVVLIDSEKNKESRKISLQTQKQEIETKLLEIKTEEEQNRKVCNSVKEELRSFLSTKRMREMELKSSLERMKEKEEDMDRIKEIIKKQTDVSSNQKLVQEQRDKIAELERRKTGVWEMYETSENDLMQYRNAITQKNHTENTLKAEINEVMMKVRQKQMQIQSLTKNIHNSISVYGSEMPRLLEAINAAKEQFKHVPRGPIGAHITLKDKKWALAIEDFLSSGLLRTFCVDNHQDSQKLSEILSKICGNMRKPTIICSKFFFTMHNVSNFKVAVPDGCVALIDAMIIDDPVVMNCLIDQLSIETVLLLPDSETAYSIMSSAKNVPRNCNRAITIKGDQFYPDPNYRSYACRSKGAKFLLANTSDVISQYENNIKELKTTLEGLQNQEKLIHKDIDEVKMRIRTIQMNIVKFQKVQCKLQTEIDELKLQEPPTAIRVDILVEELNQTTKYVESRKSLHETFKTEIQSLELKIQAKETEVEECKNLTRNLGVKLQPLVDEITEIKEKLSKLEINSRYNENRIAKFREKCNETSAKYQENKKILETTTKEVEELGEPVDTKRSVQTIKKEIETIQRHISDAKMNLGDKLFITRKYLEIKKNYVDIKDALLGIKNCLQELQKSNHDRLKYYNHLRKTITINVQGMFTGILKIRQFQGSLQIDHGKKSLAIIVKPQHGSQGSGQTNTLSGGERSYSTVSFLLSLWQVMDFPFYILDEFDVFLDTVNRRTVMDLLGAHAKDKKNQQYIFLTPQDVSSVVGDKAITVYRMNDPIRKRRHETD